MKMLNDCDSESGESLIHSELDAVSCSTLKISERFQKWAKGRSGYPSPSPPWFYSNH